MAIPIPRWAYVPGGDLTPDRLGLEQAKGYVPSRFADYVPWQHSALLYGILLNDCELYWESHEVLEAVWKAAPMNGPDRVILQGLIQIANAGLKQKMGRGGAAGRLVKQAQELLREFLARKAAVDEASLAGRIRAEEIADQLSSWSVGAKLYLTPAMFPPELEPKCIEGREPRWTTTTICTIMHHNSEGTHGG